MFHYNELVSLHPLLKASGGSQPNTPPFLTRLQAQHPAFSMPLVVKAFAIAKDMYAGAYQHNGEPRLCHAAASALILAKLGLDAPSIAAALLYAVLEDKVVDEQVGGAGRVMGLTGEQHVSTGLASCCDGGQCWR